MGNYFSGWYAANKEALAAKRKSQYQNDPVYRAKVIGLSRAARMAKRGVAVPPGYVHHMADAADVLGVTIWSLREWRKKKYFPEPFDNGGRKWFTAHQVQLLGNLRDFFARRGNRISREAKPALEDLVSLVYANWI